MMLEKEDLRLSLSLGCSGNNTAAINGDHENHRSLHFNLMPSSSVLLAKLPLAPAAALPNTTWLHSFASSDRFSESLGEGGTTAAPSHGFVDPRSFLRGITVNRQPANAAEDDGVSSPNSTVSSVSGKRSEREITAIDDDHENERACSRSGSDEDDGDTSRKKLRLSKDQSAVLEETFKEHSTLNPKQKQALSKKLGLRPRQVEVWFQNRRARTKLKQTEVDCELLKRCCEQLTEDNRRLQKEVQELRGLKLSPQFYMQMTPPTTLTMCPSCVRVGSAADTKLHRGTPMKPWGRRRLCRSSRSISPAGQDRNIGRLRGAVWGKHDYN